MEAEAFIKKVDFDKGNGLVPVVLQDASNYKVLMQAYMNMEALRLTLTKGRMHFWSRTRRRLWLKGEESSHYSILENAILDCDNDSILFKVQQIGNICHTGKETCFHNPVLIEKENPIDAKIAERIYEIIVDQINNPIEKSHVSTLLFKDKDMINKKIVKEVTNIIETEKGTNTEEIVHKATELFFHFLVLLAKKDVKIQEIFKELEHFDKIKIFT